MRILHIVHQYPPDYMGGTEFYTQQLAAAQVAAGHDVAVFFRRNAKRIELAHWIEPTGVQVYAASNGEVTPTNRVLATFRDAGIDAQFQQLLNQFQPDVAHIQHLMGLPASLAAKLSKSNIPYVITLHDYWWFCANAQLLTNYDQTLCNGPKMHLNCSSCAISRVREPQRGDLFVIPPLALTLATRTQYLKSIMAKAKALFHWTQFVAQIYTEQGADANKLIFAPPGLITSPPQIEMSHNDTSGPLRVGYVGGISFQKGVHLLVDAVRGEPGVRAWVAGDLEFDPDYSKSLQNIDHGRVNFLGKLDRVDLWQKLAQSDLLVVPSLWYETFGIVISEAFAAGIPVVVSNIGVLQERVQDGIDGRHFRVGDSGHLRHILKELRNNKTQLEKLKDGARKRAAEMPAFSQHVTTIQNHYQQIVTS